ncbi:MAG: transglycosylase domain-containing protein [Bacteroidales bacterium]|jgi:penicillin-binding protein 1A|nr:transglycosylase domain-containing protein [Bacteroidales bacterium]
MGNSTSFGKYLIWFWGVYVACIALIAVFFSLVARGAFGLMPSFEELENPKYMVATEVFSRDGKALFTYFQDKGNRTQVDFSKLPPDLVNALVATEDVRYYNHSGIDLRGLFRAIKGIITGDSSSGGGSTISQQLAKMLFPRDPYESKMKLVVRKFKEWVIAVKLERSYTKEEIVAMYLNMYDFVNNAIGIRSASRIYFGVPPDSLHLHQSAMLVGMAKNAAMFNPVRFPDRTLQRRNVVLAQMKKYNYITSKQYDSIAMLPLDLRFRREDFKLQSAPYFREYLRITMEAKKPVRKDYPSWATVQFQDDSLEWEINPLFGWCNKNVKPDGTKYNIYGDGLRIYSTIDSRMQRYAEEAVEEHLKKELQPVFSKGLKNMRRPPFSNDLSEKEVNDQLTRIMRQSERYRVLKAADKSDDEIAKIFDIPVKTTVFSWRDSLNYECDTTLSPMDSIRYTLSILRSAFMAMDVFSGEVRAYVGGPNYRFFMYDMIKRGRRQVGSTVKPFLYALAMQNGYTPCTMAPNVPQEFVLYNGQTWSPKNSGLTSKDGEMVTLRWGLANSVNNISAWLLKKFNPPAMEEMMRKFGITGPIDPVPTICVGAPEVKLFDMVAAYATFVNKGVYTQPIFVTRIEDKAGNVIARFQPARHDALDANTAYTMVTLLESVVNGGTAARLRFNKSYGGLTGAIGGKTGTTNDNSDGWFMGITPRIAAGVWTGGDMRSIRFTSTAMGQGANAALPVWARFMHKVYDDASLEYKPEQSFEAPAGYPLNLNCDDDTGVDATHHSNTDEFF